MTQTIQEAAEAYTMQSSYGSETYSNSELAEVETRAFTAGAEWAEPKWIPVTEQLPEVGQLVLFIVSSRDDWYNGKIWGGRYTGHDFSVPGIGFLASRWCPIPDSLLNFKP